jgi:hypothetical protein
MRTCECKVSDSIVKGVNKTVNERLQTKWLDGQIRVRGSDTSENVLGQLQIIQIQHTCSQNVKNRIFRSYPFRTFPA